MKYVIITGGPCHGIGKGTVAATVAYILKQTGLNVSTVKFDGLLNRYGKEPYHNKIDVMYEKEEAFILDDGFIADSDLGLYERFLDKNLGGSNNILNGECWNELLSGEHKVGEIIKIRPHLINLYRSKIEQASMGSDAVVIEVGGTVGDNENIFFLQALKDIKRSDSTDFLSIHVSYIYGERDPEEKGMEKYVSNSFILKPAKQCILKLGEYGLDPDIVICRMYSELNDADKSRLSEATGIPKNDMFSSADVDNTYFILENFRKQKLDVAICKKLTIRPSPFEKRHVDFYLEKLKKASGKLKISIFGDTEGWDSFDTLTEALEHSSVDLGYKCDVRWISEQEEDISKTTDANGFIITEGLESIEQKFFIAKYCRKNLRPILGISAGSQIMLAEFVASRLNMGDLFQELDGTENSLILKKDMRIGGQRTRVSGLFRSIYGKPEIRERHRHTGEINLKYVGNLESIGVDILGLNDKGLVDAFVLRGTESIGVQYHPEYSSRPGIPNPLIRSFTEKTILAR